MARTLFQERLRCYLVKEEELQRKSCAYAIISTMLVCALAFVFLDWISDTLGKWQWLFYLCFFSTLAVYGRSVYGRSKERGQGRSTATTVPQGLMRRWLAKHEELTDRSCVYRLVSTALVVLPTYYALGGLKEVIGELFAWAVLLFVILIIVIFSFAKRAKGMGA